MKRLYVFILLVNITAVIFAINLPSFPFYGSNELYEENHDHIEFETGTKIKGINIVLENVAGEWGEYCLNDYAFGDPYDCQQCCVDKWKEFDNDPAYNASYTTCFKYCGGGPSLPLGSALWLLPFAFAYGFYKRYHNKKADC
jgi:hypothetical protein